MYLIFTALPFVLHHIRSEHTVTVTHRIQHIQRFTPQFTLLLTNPPELERGRDLALIQTHLGTFNYKGQFLCLYQNQALADVLLPLDAMLPSGDKLPAHTSTFTIQLKSTQLLQSSWNVQDGDKKSTDSNLGFVSALKLRCRNFDDNL